MSTPIVKYNGYTFPKTFNYREISNARQADTAKIPFAHGSSILATYLQERRIQVEGTLYRDEILSATTTELRAQRDTIKAALATGRDGASLYLESDRYLRNVLWSDSPESYDAGTNERIATVRLNFLCPDPFYYADTSSQSLTNAISGSPANIVLNNVSGNSFALPTLTLTVSSTGTINATITNTTNGRAFTLKGAVTSGDLIVIDSLGSTVLISSVDKISLFDGLFTRLDPGNNTLNLVYSGVTLSNLAAVWRSRWF